MIDLVFAVADGQGMIDNTRRKERNGGHLLPQPGSEIALADCIDGRCVVAVAIEGEDAMHRPEHRHQSPWTANTGVCSFQREHCCVRSEYGTHLRRHCQVRKGATSEQRPHAQPEPIPGTFQLLVVIYPIPMRSIAWFAPSRSPDCCYYLEGRAKGCREPTREGSGADFSDYGFTNSGSMAFSTAC